MALLRYFSNNQVTDKFTKVDFFRDNGSKVEIQLGKLYDLSQTEANLLAGHIQLIPDTGSQDTPLQVSGNESQFIGTKGTSSALSNVGVDLQTTSTPVVAANAMRDVLILTNASDTGQWITLAVSGAQVGQGIYLGPNGGQWSEQYSGPACGLHIGSSGTKRIGVVEL